MLRNLIVAPLLAVALTSCVGVGASMITKAAYLDERADAYVRSVHDLRLYIRDECRASLIREVDILKKEGKEAELRKMLGSVYPPLVTFGIIADAQDGGVQSILVSPIGCE